MYILLIVILSFLLLINFLSNKRIRQSLENTKSSLSQLEGELLHTKSTLEKLEINKDLLHKEYRESLENKTKEIKLAREDAVKKSRSVIRGSLSEQSFPLLAQLELKHPIKEYKFVGGDPIDYICFKGLSACKDGTGDFEEVVFIDIKTGKASLTSTQRKIKKAVKEGKVKWVTYRIDEEGNITEDK